MTMITYDEILTVARCLPLADRLRLVSTLADEAIGEITIPSIPPMSSTQSIVARDEIRAAFAALPTPRKTLGEQLEADRQERDHALI